MTSVVYFTFAAHLTVDQPPPGSTATSTADLKCRSDLGTPLSLHSECDPNVLKWVTRPFMSWAASGPHLFPLAPSPTAATLAILLPLARTKLTYTPGPFLRLILCLDCSPPHVGMLGFAMSFCSLPLSPPQRLSLTCPLKCTKAAPIEYFPSDHSALFSAQHLLLFSATLFGALAPCFEACFLSGTAPWQKPAHSTTLAVWN